ncbi:hypothetical protein LINPERHAP1_LOCUS32145, partial [Linum perenne]
SSSSFPSFFDSALFHLRWQAVQWWGHRESESMDLRAEQAWEQAEGSVIKPPLVRLMPGRPKRNRRKER